MNKNKVSSNSNEETNKYCDPCVNHATCKGKWFKYKSKEDKGFCKSCIKLKMKN